MKYFNIKTAFYAALGTSIFFAIIYGFAMFVFWDSDIPPELLRGALYVIIFAFILGGIKGVDKSK